MDQLSCFTYMHIGPGILASHTQSETPCLNYKMLHYVLAAAVMAIAQQRCLGRV